MAGAEAAWQAARLGCSVTLYEMRPGVMTGAHVTGELAELVCSNSLGSKLPDRATGMLFNELRELGALLPACADACAVPAGGALAVDRQAFANLVTQRLTEHPRIRIERREVAVLPDGHCILASGPLTSPGLAAELECILGCENLYFFDALAPIVQADSIDMTKVFRASRYSCGESEEGDYINCPFDRASYEAFVDALLAAERIPLRSFEQAMEKGVRGGAHTFFEGCLPLEILAHRGRDALAYGPFRPVGLRDPRTDKRPYAVLQLRQDSIAGDLYNLVGCQTNLTYPEQKRIFRLIPGLEKAIFVRFGHMHRNTFINAPVLLDAGLCCKKRDGLFLAGQLTGVEGYMGNIGTGFVAGCNAALAIRGLPPLALAPTTMMGALCHYISHAEAASFQPMKANFGILPSVAVTGRMSKADRYRHYRERGWEELKDIKNRLTTLLL